MLGKCSHFLYQALTLRTVEPYINMYVKFQLKKLGVMPPEQPLPVKCNRIYQIIWANNGDAISRQYAGTAALKVKGESVNCSGDE